MKLFTLTAAFIIAAASLTSCTSSTSKEPPENFSDTAEEREKNGAETVITLAAPGCSAEMIKCIDAFNSEGNGYRLEVLDYSKEPTVVDGNTVFDLSDFELIQDMINTDKIDLISSMSFHEEANYRRLLEKGAFADFNQFLADDSEINRTTLNDHVLSLIETDGMLCSLPLSFTVHTMGGDPQYVGTKANWTFDDVVTHWDKMPSNTVINGSRTREAAYRTFLADNLSEFVDFGASTVSFDSVDFRKALEFCSRFEYANGEKVDWELDAPVFCSAVDISSFQSVFPYELGSSSPKMTYVGFPSSDGSGAYLRSFDGCWSICAGSSAEKQRGAWEFIRRFFTAEYQAEHCMSWDDKANGYGTQHSFPLNVQAMEELKCNTAAKKYAPETFESKGEIFETKFPTMEDCNALEEYIASVKRWETRVDDGLSSIVREEVMEYFADEITLDQCIERIQNRGEIWISEKG